MSKECPVDMYVKELNDPQFDRDAAVESALIHLRNDKKLFGWIPFQPYLLSGISALAQALTARINWDHDMDYAPSGINLQRAMEQMGRTERSLLCDALQKMVRKERNRKNKECN